MNDTPSTSTSADYSPESPVLETLHFSCHHDIPSSPAIETASDTQCLFCEENFSLNASEKDGFLKHLLEQHKFVISDVQLIADFKQYVEYWRTRFKENILTEFCAVIETNSQEENPDLRDRFYLLCDKLPEDKKIRVQLQRQELVLVLSQQQKEREDSSFSRSCLFCRAQFTNRADLFNHMNIKHNFNVGLPDNLVFTDKLLDLLQEKLTNLRCLYCENLFHEWNALRDHMRKKKHKKIDPKNKAYDKFYVINYLELGRSWEAIQSEDDRTSGCDTENEDGWDEMEDADGSATAVCLFCDVRETVIDKLKQHMKEAHCFDLCEIKARLELNFYQQVKLVNYIRRQVHHNTCIGCQKKYSSKQDLFSHMTELQHYQKLPDLSEWDQPQYYFPTFEDDNLLCCLEDNEEDDSDNSGHENTVVVPEDREVPDSILKVDSVRQDVMSS